MTHERKKNKILSQIVRELNRVFQKNRKEGKKDLFSYAELLPGTRIAIYFTNPGDVRNMSPADVIRCYKWDLPNMLGYNITGNPRNSEVMENKQGFIFPVSCKYLKKRGLKLPYSYLFKKNLI